MAPSQTVTFTSAAGEASGFLARPGTEIPGIIVLQEWWGLVPHIKDVAERLASQGGYTVLAPDMYHGKSTVDAEEASHLMQGLDWGRAAQEIAGAITYLRQTERVTRVGLVGFCMGGALATLGAATAPGVDAYVAFYGFAKDAPLEKITAPGLLIFGEQETFFSVPDAQKFAEKQRQRGRNTEVIIYPGAGHGFFNNERQGVYDEPSANDAWRRTLAHFGKYLRG